MVYNENESAVSESIGVILILAITVIMASIIAAYAFGMMNGVPASRTIAVTADQPDPSHILVTYRGGPNQQELASLTIIWPDGTQQIVSSPNVGDVYTATGANVTAGKDHVVVSATWTNNQSQVVLDTFV